MKKRGIKKDKNVRQTVPVLYQNIGGEVYAFAQVGGDVYFGKVPVRASAKYPLTQSAIDVLEKEVA